MGKINVEAEKNELILENEFGDKVIIPAKKRQWVQKQIEKGNHADLDNYISTLPIKSDFAEEGSVVPGDPTKKVKVYTGKPEYFVQGVAPRNGERKNEDGSVSTHLMSYTSADDVHYAYPTLFQDGDKWIQLDDKDDWAAFKEAQKRKELFKFDNEEDAKKFAEGSWKTENIKEYDIDSPEYRELYNSGAIANYDKNSDTYILSKPLDEVVITAEAPQWAKDKRKYESQYTKDWYIDNKMPKFSRSMGVSATNMHSNNVKEYDDFINNKIVEDIFKRKPTFETDYSKDRLKTLQGFSQKELELIKNSKYAYRIEPSIWSKFEQGLLSVGNTGSSVQFKNPSLSQEEAKKEDNPLNILQPLSIPTKMVQSAYKDGYSFTDALKGKKNNAGIVEDIVTDPLNLVGVGLASKLSKADKVIDAAKVGSKILNKTDDVAENFKHLEYAKNYYSKYGYSIPENLAEIAKNSKLTDETIQGLVNQHNTFVRGVSTNWDEIAKKNPEILRHLEGKGIDYINNPQAAAEYMSTHVPIQTGYGRAGLNENVFREGKDAIYTSNSIPTAEGYTYGDGYIVKVKRPTDFSSKNRIDWINSNKLDYFEDNLKIAPKEIKDKFLKLTEERYIKEIEPKYFDKNGNWKNGKVLQKELNYDNWVLEQEIRQELGLSVEKQYNLLKTEGSNKTYLEKINDNIIVPEQFLDRIGVPESTKIMTQITKDVGKIYNPKLIKLEEDIFKIRRQYPEDMVSKKRFGIDDYKIEDKYNKLLNELKSTREESILKVKEQQLKYLKDNYKDKLNEVDRYAHYLHVGKVGDKLLEPIEAIRITPDIWKNKSRAHTNIFSKGMSAGSLIPFYLYLQSQQNNNEGKKP